MANSVNTMLIIDHDPAIQSALTQTCEAFGFHVTTDFNGTATNGLIPSLILIGVSVEHSTRDLETLTQARTRFPHTAILALVPEGANLVAAQALQKGARFSMPRTPSSDTLKGFIEAALSQGRAQNNSAAASEAGTSELSSQGICDDFPTLAELEKRYMKIVLQKTKGRKERAARVLGINRRTLYRKEREYGWVADTSKNGVSKTTATPTPVANARMSDAHKANHPRVSFN